MLLYNNPLYSYAAGLVPWIASRPVVMFSNKEHIFSGVHQPISLQPSTVYTSDFKLQITTT